MSNSHDLLLPFAFSKDITARQFNILRSPKRGGTAYADSGEYLSELGITIADSRQPIQFTPNSNEAVHRWSPYVQLLRWLAARFPSRPRASRGQAHAS